MTPPVFWIDGFKCELCGLENPMFRWTDTHGIGACCHCGAPYKLYHYEVGPNGQERVDKDPVLLLKPEWVEILRRYHAETGRNCDPGAYNFLGDRYEVATQEDFEVFESWLDAHKDEVPND